MSLLIHEFTPLWLNIDRIGPFQERMEEIDFTDANNESCNLYLFLSKNGRGKTTALELMAALMGMLGCDDIRQMVERRGSTGERPFDLEHLTVARGALSGTCGCVTARTASNGRWCFPCWPAR